VFGAVADTLGLTPDSRIKVLVCAEGPTDVDALKHLSHALHQVDNTIPSLLTETRCAVISLGGSTLKHWVTLHYLKGLRCPEVHIYDRDIEEYGKHVAEVNGRQDGLNSWAVQTAKHEIECYLHPDAIQEEFAVSVDIVDHPDGTNQAVPRAFAVAYSAFRGWPDTMKDSKAKVHLTKAFQRMTAARIRARDQANEVEGWFRRIGGYL
jgi:putative ATP-dependent endonuclease of OLD family